MVAVALLLGYQSDPTAAAETLKNEAPKADIPKMDMPTK